MSTTFEPDWPTLDPEASDGASPKHVMHPLDHTGDSKTVWDPENPEEVAAARATFERLTKKGYRAFNVGGKGQKAGQMNEFDPQAEKMILVPQQAGG
jgi:hypothetical protein